MNYLEFTAALIVAVFGSNGLWAFIGSKRKGKTALERAVLALLHDRIYELAEKYIARGGITVDELDNLRYLYESYEEMGGNGTGKVLYEKCTKLPLLTEEEAHEKDSQKG